MRLYTLQAYVKRADGSLHKFYGQVSALRKVGAVFNCKAQCSLWKGWQTFQSEWPEMVYSDACNAVRFALEDQKSLLCNRKGDAKEFSPPLTVLIGRKGKSRRVIRFPAAKFTGSVIYADARREDASFYLHRTGATRNKTKQAQTSIE